MKPAAWRCTRTADMPEEKRKAKVVLESIRIYQPRGP